MFSDIVFGVDMVLIVYKYQLGNLSTQTDTDSQTQHQMKLPLIMVSNMHVDTIAPSPQIG